MTENEMKKIYELKEEGKGYYAIATALSLSPSSVKSFLLRHPKSELEIVHHCKNCGAAISQFSDGRIKRFCSLKCHRDYWNKHRKIADRKSTYQCECEECHKVFTSYGGKRRFCSRTCFQQNESRKWGNKNG